VRLGGRRFDHLRLVDVLIEDSELSGVMCRMTTWDSAEFHDVDLRAADFHAANLTGVRLLGCDLTGADLSKAR